MNRSTIDIDQMLRRRGGKLLYEGPEGRVAQCPDGLILSDITSGKALCGCLSFLLLPECGGENAVPAFDEYGHGAMTVDFDLQFAPDAAAAVDSAVREMKQWVTVV